MKNVTLPSLLSTEAAAEYLGVVPGTLEGWRCSGRYDLTYIKVGRLIRYKADDLVRFLESRTVRPVASNLPQ